MIETCSDCIYCNRSHGESLGDGSFKRSRWACEGHVKALERRLRILEDHLKIGETHSEE